MLLEFNALTLIDSSLEFRETLNGIIFVLAFNLSILLAWYMLTVRKIVGDGWNKIDGLHTACVMFWVFGIIGVRSFWVWLSLYMATAGYQTTPLFDQIANWSLICTGSVLIAVTLWATYLFSPESWHSKTWTASASLALLFILITKLWS